MLINLALFYVWEDEMQKPGLVEITLLMSTWLSGARVLHFSHPEFLSAHTREWLSDPKGICLLPECP